MPATIDDPAILDEIGVTLTHASMMKRRDRLRLKSWMRLVDCQVMTSHRN